ncbi:hypothetical protein [Ferruginibacter albus]|uniref:hypothetical protein n=1 Tax=Ferruginibacter albus TaxID=2875540 RepID=UPI001CC7EF02|nr:hypothetical protein [Ferruginibacter albus]UAY50972.1 hypothetical protein K9M53_10270 [Ferruginibacter albus]
MIRIYFNIAAFFQALLIVLICICYTFIDDRLLHLTNEISIEKFYAFFLQIAAFICVIMDVKGLHGRVLFLPTWLLCIVTSIFLGEIGWQDKSPMLWILLALSILIIFIYIYKMPAHLRKEWSEKKAAANQLKLAISKNPISDKDFWSIASNMFYSPSLLFTFCYSAWKFIFRHAIDEQEVLEHYRFMINTMPIDTIKGNRYKNWMISLKKELNNTKDTSGYIDPFMITRLGNLINDMNSSFK